MRSRKARAEGLSDDIRILREEPPSRVIDLTETMGPTDLMVFDGESGPSGRSSGLRWYRVMGFALIPIDVLCLGLALFAAHMLRFGVRPSRDYLIGIAIAAILWIGVFHALGLYQPHHFSWLEEFRRTVGAVGIGVVGIILLTFWLDVYLSRSWLALTLALAFALEVAARRLVRSYVSHERSRESLLLRTIVFGSRDEAAKPLRALGKPGSGYLPLGYVDAMNPLLASEELAPSDRVGRLRSLIRQHRPDCVFIATARIETTQVLALMQAARKEGALVRVHAHLPGILESRVAVQDLGGGDFALALRPAGLTPVQRGVKRAMDLVLAGLLLIAMSPIMLATALAVRVTSGRPVVFCQERVTDGNRTFRMYKFRTMVTGGHEDESSGEDTSAPFFKVKSDPRVTRLGRWLRRWSVDELPQLFNVLLGNMSLVGPRPLPVEQVAVNIELLGPRHEVRAGITGWWQINGRSELEHEEAIRMDHFYIENWSPSLDLYILLRTVGALLTRKGAY